MAGTATREIDGQLRRAHEQTKSVCEELEKGYAYAPLTDHVQALKDGLQDSGLGILLLGEDQGMVREAASWLAATPLEEIEAAVEAAEGMAVVEAPGLEVWIPEAVAHLFEEPEALARVLPRATALVYVASADHRPEGADAARVAELCDLLPLALPVVRARDEEADASRAARPRWRLGTRTVLPPVVFSGTEPLDRPAWIQTGDDELRQVLRAAHASSRLDLACTMIEDEVERRIRHARFRQADLARETRRSAADASQDTVRARVDSARQGIQQTFAALSKEIQSTSKQALQPRGSLTNEIQDLVGQLRTEEIVATPSGRTIKFSLHDGYMIRVGDAIRAAIRRMMGETLRTVRDAEAEVQQEASDALTAIRGHTVPYELPRIDEPGLWRSLRPLLDCEVRYASERPKKNFLHRLGEGRRAMFSVMMLLSMVGMVTGISARTALGGIVGVAMGALLIFGIVRTYTTWRAEEEEFLDKELVRVKDSVTSEARRAANDGLREMSTIVGEHVSDTSRRVLKDVDVVVKEVLDSKRAAADVQRRELQERNKLLELQVREQIAVQQQQTKLAQTCRELATGVRQALRDAGRKKDA